jgi:hypothetical protein
MEVRYEDLVADAGSVVRSICDFIQLEFDPVMLRFWERTPERLREHRTRHRLDGSLQVTHEQRLVQQKMTMYPPDPIRIFNWKREM